MLATTLPDTGKASADLNTLDRVDAHHGRGNVGVETVIDGFAPADWHATGDYPYPGAD